MTDAGTGTVSRLSSISFKLASAFGIGLVLIFTVGIVGLIGLQAVNDVTHGMRQTWVPRLDQIGDIARAANTHDLLASRRTQSLGFRELAAAGRALGEAREEVEEEIAQYPPSVSDAERRLLETFTSRWQRYLDSIAMVLDRMDSGQGLAAQEQFGTETRALFRATIVALEGLETFADSGIEGAELQARAVYAQSQLFVAMVIGLASLTAMLAVYWGRRTISTPLLRISRAMERLTRGDESVSIEDGGHRRDEIGTLLAAAKDYRDSVIRVRRLGDEAEMERGRLAAAIANMPIGFCMFDADNRLIVCNEAFADIYRLPPEVTKPGTPHEAIVAARIRQDTYNGADPVAFATSLKEIIAAGKPKAGIWELPDGRTISTFFQPVEKGFLATHEDITERRRSEQRIAHMARHDALTDLPNRVLFRERVDNTLTQLPRDKQVAVLMIDLDRFKNVNDTLGHPVGDQLLRAVADRMRANIGDGDTIARFGGDEFAVIQIDADQPTAARSLAERLIDALSESFEVVDHHLSIGASVGIALAPGDGDTAETLIKNADMALYRSKADGRGAYRFFEADMDARMQARRHLELALRGALARGEFQLNYQPIIDLQTNSVAGFEALIRWHHPERGLVSPGEFIPLAEEVGLIIPLGEWILKQACTDAASWPHGIKVAVNLSPVQFRSKRLVEAVISAIAISKLEPERLELEITEGVLLANSEETLATLHKLRALGVHIAMDDFGTGYSSLSYLQSFPFDKIKIDGSFIRRMGSDESSMAIIRAVTGLGTSLGMITTAEGVETSEQLDRVRSEGVTEVQGFLFSEARPGREVAALIERLAAKGMSVETAAA